MEHSKWRMGSNKVLGQILGMNYRGFYWTYVYGIYSMNTGICQMCVHDACFTDG